MATSARIREWVLADLRGDHEPPPGRPAISTRMIIAGIGLALVVVALILATAVSRWWAGLCGTVGTLLIIEQLFGAWRDRKAVRRIVSRP